MKMTFDQVVWGLLRIAMGWIFLWAFIDKVWGLGFATEPGQGWVDGVSPTFGYLSFATKGPFASIFQALAGSLVVDVLFMAGLFGVGVALLVGIKVKLASYAGAVMLFLMFLAASLPPEHNPVIDEHIIYILILILFSRWPVGDWLGLGKSWSKLSFVRQYPILK